jgi:hypothetical protein
VFFKSNRKHLLGFPDLRSYFRQVTYLEGSAVFINQGFDINPVILQVTISDCKTFLGKIESLLYKVVITIIHLNFNGLIQNTDNFYAGTNVNLWQYQNKKNRPDFTGR